MTGYSFEHRILLSRFNPHTHEGCDLRASFDKLDDFQFQSTHPRRVWRPIRKVHAHLIKFQSTHPRRVWLSDCFYPPIMISFNPHTHEGCDIANDFYRYAKWVSIHTPTKGVTQKPGISLICMISFNPHTHEGCDFTARLHFQVRCSFNPHTHEGCDPAYPYLSPCLGCFNPHTHEGCDFSIWCWKCC